MIKADQSFFTILGNTVPCFFHTLLPVQFRFGKELISKTNNLFFQTERHHLTMRNR